MDIVDRIKYLMKLNGLSASSFADEIGVQRSSVSHILSGRNKPSLDFVNRILNRYDNVSADWLLLGNKTVTPEAESTPIETKKVVETKVVSSQKEDNQPINSDSSGKKVTKVMVFYSDGSFEEYNKTS